MGQSDRMPPLIDDLSLLARLVAFDTTSDLSTLPIADFVTKYLRRPGVRIDRVPCGPDKVNLVAWCGPAPSPDRPGLVLCGHMDVWPATEPGWSSPPFRLAQREGRLFGRGACDMKGFLALAMNRARAFDPNELTAPLVLVFTSDEERGTLGARSLFETWPPVRSLPRAAIIGEPTELRAVRMHKGHLKLRIVFHGIAAHSGYPHLGRNAIEPAARAVVALSALRAELETERVPTSLAFEPVPYVALNVGVISGGTAPNVIPERCVLELGIRVLPGVESASLTARVESAIHRALGDEGRYQLEMVGDSPPMELSPEADIYRRLTHELGQQAEFAVSFATDAGWFARAGLECVVWGPGSIENAHRADESLPRAELTRAGEILDRMIRHFCLPEAT